MKNCNVKPVGTPLMVLSKVFRQAQDDILC